MRGQLGQCAAPDFLEAFGQFARHGCRPVAEAACMSARVSARRCGASYQTNVADRPARSAARKLAKAARRAA